MALQDILEQVIASIIIATLRRLFSPMIEKVRLGIIRSLLLHQISDAHHLAHPTWVSINIIRNPTRVTMIPDSFKTNPLSIVFQHRAFLDLSRQNLQDTID
ncbi:hypothetical protein AUI46_03115 [archaeon 13_1_40CM_2_52_13]|nr:MAG: hypothetical protein AUI46_03115 [archaeon 13_1_40CM_2_52_13]